MQLWQSLLSHLLVLEEARVVLAGEEGDESGMLLAFLTSFLGEQIQKLSVCVNMNTHACMTHVMLSIVIRYTCTCTYSHMLI